MKQNTNMGTRRNVAVELSWIGHRIIFIICNNNEKQKQKSLDMHENIFRWGTLAHANNIKSSLLPSDPLLSLAVFFADGSVLDKIISVNIRSYRASHIFVATVING